MIGHLKGTVLSVSTEGAVIDVQGVGYEIAATSRLLDRMRVGEAASLAIETMVREDFIRLIAFEDADERACFRLLQSVQGVGAKAALAILQVLPTDAVLDAIAMGDETAITRAQGVGKKIATRIITELKSKVDPLQTARGVVKFAPAQNGKAVGPTKERTDAVSALTNLGYDAGAARLAVTRYANDNPQAKVEDLIRQGLKELATL
jgi:holliday junction DNA helicase RuvA